MVVVKCLVWSEQNFLYRFSQEPLESHKRLLCSRGHFAPLKMSISPTHCTTAKSPFLLHHFLCVPYTKELSADFQDGVLIVYISISIVYGQLLK